MSGRLRRGLVGGAAAAAVHGVVVAAALLADRLFDWRWGWSLLHYLRQIDFFVEPVFHWSVWKPVVSSLGRVLSVRMTEVVLDLVVYVLVGGLPYFALGFLLAALLFRRRHSAS